MKISTRQEKANVVLQIEDTGCGIKPEDLDKLFDPFYTTKPVRSVNGAPTGTGLGLPSVKRMLAGYGGKIEISSVLGAGTTVTVTLPPK